MTIIKLLSYHDNEFIISIIDLSKLSHSPRNNVLAILRYVKYCHSQGQYCMRYKVNIACITISLSTVVLNSRIDTKTWLPSLSASMTLMPYNKLYPRISTEMSS